jgi:hypothetical protein
LALLSLRRSFRLEVVEKRQELSSCLGWDSFAVVAEIEVIESQRKAWLDLHLLSDLSQMCLEYVPDFFCCLDVEVSSLIPTSSRFPRFSFSCLSSL